MGAMIVADALCFGARAFAQVPAGEGPALHRLAETYLSSIFCPRMYKDYAQRRDLFLETARRSRRAGPSTFNNKFCDLHGVDSVLVRKDLGGGGHPGWLGAGEGIQRQGGYREGQDRGYRRSWRG